MFVLAANSFRRESNFHKSEQSGLPQLMLGWRLDPIKVLVPSERHVWELYKGRVDTGQCEATEQLKCADLLTALFQSVKKSMSPRRRCLDGSNCVNPLHCKFALCRRPNNVTRQTAQKVACKGLSKFKWLLKANRKWGVIGFFWDTVKRFTRLFRRSVVANWELFLVGSVRPCSRCRMRTAFK